VSGALLDGLRVVELADEQAEYVGLLLAGLGAEVIKVEPPAGSPTRRIGPFLDDIEGAERSLHFWAFNRGKRSVVLDLSDPSGHDQLRGLLASADVLVESAPRGFLDELGLTPMEHDSGVGSKLASNTRLVPEEAPDDFDRLDLQGRCRR